MVHFLGLQDLITSLECIVLLLDIFVMVKCTDFCISLVVKIEQSSWYESLATFFLAPQLCRVRIIEVVMCLFLCLFFGSRVLAGHPTTPRAHELYRL